MRRFAALAALLFVAALPAAGQINLLNEKPAFGENSAAKSTVHVELLADKIGIAPGGTVALAIPFTIDKEYHIYWRNSGEGGQSTTFRWTHPPGYEVGPMQWPIPHRSIEQEIDSQTFVLEGRPTVLTTLKAPTDAKIGDRVPIKVEVDWLVCKKNCVKGSKLLSLELPVVAKEDVKPADEKIESVFKAASNHISVAADKAKYLSKIEARADVDQIKPGQAFNVSVVLHVQNDHHLNSHEPLSEYLIPTDLFHDSAEKQGLALSRPVFPPGRVETSKSGEKLSLYRGDTVLVLPVKADNVLKNKEARISGIVSYQACSDSKGQCYPPTAVEWALTLPVSHASAAAPPSVAPSNATASPATSQPVAIAESNQIDQNPTTTQPTAATSTRPKIGPAQTSATWLGRIQAALLNLGIVGDLLMALIGGFLLNLMPCVLPVISIKILSFVQQAKEDRLRVLTLGLAFSGGILLSFIALGILIISAGQHWGGLFQSPYAVLIISSLVTAFALSLFGVFALQPPRLVTHLGERVHREGHVNAFCMGLLATALGTACTAPFLGLVLALAAQQTAALGMLIFIFAGIGMAFPYVLLAAKPGWLKIIPRPGPWMKTFEHLMGFLLLGTVAWLLFSLEKQLGGEGLFWALVFLIMVALASWLYGRAEFGLSVHKQLMYYVTTLVCIVFGWMVCFSGDSSIPRLLTKAQTLRRVAAQDQDLAVKWDQQEFPWKIYTREKALEAVRSGYTVFVDYTASYCLNCKSNEKFIIDTPEVRERMKQLGVVPFQADYSSGDPEIGADLDKYGRQGVPMYLVIPAEKPNDVRLLDEILTKGAVLDALKDAGPSKRPAALVMSADPTGIALGTGSDRSKADTEGGSPHTP